MRKLITALCLATLALASCGGDENSLNNPGGGTPPPGTPGGGPIISKVDVITDNPQIPSDGGIPAVITAFVKDTNNNFVTGTPVTFSATSGGLVVTQGTTNANGIASASLTTAGDPSNRTITVTATAGTLTKTIDVFVTGSQLSVTGPDSLVQNDTAAYTFILVDGSGTGISGQSIEVLSQNSNTLEATTLTTDAAGQASVNLTAVNGGQDILTGTGLGLSASQTIDISDDSFSFKSPAPTSEIALGAIQVVTVEWLKNGAPQTNRTISFSTTRGEFVGIVGPPQVNTDGAGRASISLRSNNAGPSVITAVASGGPTTQLAIEFIATVPDTIDVQADPFTIAPNNQSTITAVVRDADNNRVKNARVVFSLEDVTGGSLSVGSGQTDSQGRAQTFYTASDSVSGNLGVEITAALESDPTLNDTVQLTVARRELFVAIGTGNELEEPDATSYEVPYLVLVTDSEGNGVPDANVQVNVRSVRYNKGYWEPDVSGENWTTRIRAVCEDEDLNGNGILDDGEIDANFNGTIEAGNVVQAVGGNAITDSEGKAIVTLRYAQLYGAWTEIELRAQLSVAGTEFSEDLAFVLQVTADDVDIDNAPPGLLKPPDDFELPGIGPFISSPWGYAGSCAQDF